MTRRAKRVPYSRERKAQALAFARIAGAEVASERTHIPVQSIRRWMDAAGVQPGADLPHERLEALRDLAEATVTADLVAGRIRGVQAMTVAGIARRHIAKPAPQPDPQTSVQEAIDELEAIVAEVYPETDLSTIIEILLTHDRLSGVYPDDDAATTEEHGSLKAAQEWQRAEEVTPMKLNIAALTDTATIDDFEITMKAPDVGYRFLTLPADLKRLFVFSVIGMKAETEAIGLRFRLSAPSGEVMPTKTDPDENAKRWGVLKFENEDDQYLVQGLLRVGLHFEEAGDYSFAYRYGPMEGSIPLRVELEPGARA